MTNEQPASKYIDDGLDFESSDPVPIKNYTFNQWEAYLMRGMSKLVFNS